MKMRSNILSICKKARNHRKELENFVYNNIYWKIWCTTIFIRKCSVQQHLLENLVYNNIY